MALIFFQNFSWHISVAYSASAEVRARVRIVLRFSHCNHGNGIILRQVSQLETASPIATLSPMATASFPTTTVPLLATASPMATSPMATASYILSKNVTGYQWLIYARESANSTRALSCTKDGLEILLSRLLHLVAIAGNHSVHLRPPKITLIALIIFITLRMLRLLSSKTQGCKDFWKTSKPCCVGIHWLALTEYPQMRTHLPGFQSFSRIFCIILYWSK